MKKAPSIRGTALDADDHLRPVASAPSPSFRIAKFERCDFKAKQATFTLEFEGLGTIDGELFIPQDREPFIQGASVRCKYTGNYVRTVRFEEELRAEILDAVLARLKADDEQVV